MLRLRRDQPSLWESVLPQEMLILSAELTKIDALLSDERFFAPFRDRFSCGRGRPTVPVATYLRLMYLKRRYGLGYESLVKEVNDSFSWRRFCQLSFNEPVPDATTLIKLTHKYGEETVKSLNDTLVLKLKEERLVRGKKLRLDTYVIEADIHYPTDTSLLADGIKVITRAVAQVKKFGVARQSGFVNHTRRVKKILCGICRVVKERVSLSSARLGEAKKKLLKLARQVVARGKGVQVEAEAEVVRCDGKVASAVSRLRRWLEGTEKVIEQTEAVLEGQTRLPGRVVSLFDTEARPIVRGKARSPVEFGRKVLLGETDKGIITTYRVFEGNPADNTLLCAGVKGHRRLFRKRLKAVTADRGFQSRKNEEWLAQQKVPQVALPFRGRPSQERRTYERQLWFQRLMRFRAGAEGRISVLKRLFGLGRSPMRGNAGTEIWVGQGIFTQNLWQAARS